MKEPVLDRYKSAWKKEQTFERKNLSDNDIKKFLQTNSKSITRLFRTGLTFDIILKSVLIISFIVLLFLFWNNKNIILINVFLSALTIASIFFQLITFRKIPKNNHMGQSIRTLLNEYIIFYNSKYVKALLVGALSNALFFLSGIMYYFYFKYGDIRPFQFDDYIVFGGGIILSFVIGAFIQIKQHNFQIRQLESCLKDIDENTINEFSIRKQKNQRTKNIIIVTITLIFGLLLLTYFIFQ